MFYVVYKNRKNDLIIIAGNNKNDAIDKYRYLKTQDNIIKIGIIKDTRNSEIIKKELIKISW
jgi:hypothetical protein